MKKQLLTSVLIIGVVAGMMGAGTVALFSDSEEMTGVTFTTGYADLQLTQSYMGSWHNTASASDLGVDFPDNIYPGYEGTWGNPDGTIYLGNFGTVNLTVKATINDYQQDVNVKDTIKMKIAWGGNADGTGWHTLNWWKNNKAALFDGDHLGHDHSGHFSGYADYIKIMLKVPSSAGNEIAGATVSFDIQFDATQAP